MGHPAGMAPRTLLRRRVVSAWRRLLREEEGVALVLAIISMLVLTIALTTVLFMTAAGARDAHRSNAGQKASALAESGINNALAVLNANYPGVIIYPGDSTLLPTRTTTYPTGSVTWSGTLVNVPTNPAGWKWQWELTALGSVKNPTGPTAGDVVRRATAVVPVVIPDSTSVPPGTTATDWIYGLNDVTFGQSVIVAAPVYAGHDLILDEHVDDLRDDPGVAHPARASEQDRGRAQPVAREPAEPGRPRQRLGRSGQRPGRDPRREPVLDRRTTRPPTPASGGPPTRSGASSTTTSSRPATSRLRRSPAAAPSPGRRPQTARRTRQRPPTPSYMGFWYLNAGLGPKTPCASFQRRAAEVRHRERDARQHDQPERLLARQPVRSHRRATTAARRRTARRSWRGTERPSRSREPSSSTGARGARPETRSTSAKGRSSSAGSTRWTTTPRSA